MSPPPLHSAASAAVLESELWEVREQRTRVEKGEVISMGEKEGK